MLMLNSFVRTTGEQHQVMATGSRRGNIWDMSGAQYITGWYNLREIVCRHCT